jgi:dihydropyrimidine dehydrogenase (NAD+) subunit PreA
VNASTRLGQPGRRHVSQAPVPPFAETTPPLTGEAALAEAERCLFCFDAPCAAACPTNIDIPSFIRSITTGNVLGSARTILAANPLGATCARACPVEVLCEGACVRNDVDHPVAIGRLQRHATDALAASGQPFYRVGARTGKQAAVVGSGPAGLACAAELLRAGVEVTVLETRDRAGGLCDAGIVPWRLGRHATALEVAEVERAGATIRRGVALGRDVTLDSLAAENDAVFLAVGLGASRPLGVAGEDAPGVRDALDVLRRVSGGERDAKALGLGRRVAVIGGGSTALDAAAVAAKVGCDEVTLVYRRTEAEAPAHPHSIELARNLGIRFAWLAAPAAIAAGDGGLDVTFDTMRLGEPDASGRRAPVVVDGGQFSRTFDTVLRAVGHAIGGAGLDGLAVTAGGLIAVDDAGRTSNPRVWAGGDAVNGGAEVVDAVASALAAARSMEAALGIEISPATAKSAGPVFEIPRADGTQAAVDLSCDVAGIRSPNPFWLASAPPTNTGEMVVRAFEAGWGGAVWKTIGDPIVNVSPRLAAIHVGGSRVTGLNNIELITDRAIDTNLAEITEVKRLFPDRAVVASLMYPMDRDAWHEITLRVNDSGADGIELNFGCPHGMAERGMGAAVGQVPEFAARCTEYVKEVARVPVLVKLTPNVTDITAIARAVKEAGADGLAMINTINSIVGVDLGTWAPDPSVGGMGTHGGYAGPAVKPIALHMVAACAADPEVGIPISGIGGAANWRDAVEFMLLGASSVQVATSVMHHGHRIVDDMISGLAAYVAGRGLTRSADLVGHTVPTLTDWGKLDQDFHVVARIDQDRCIHCNVCHAACEDGAHQSIELRRDNGRSMVQVDEETCVGCRLCQLVCPVENCISMVRTERAPVAHDRPVRACGVM